jgi:hypothetical protein
MPPGAMPPRRDATPVRGPGSAAPFGAFGKSPYSGAKAAVARSRASSGELGIAGVVHALPHRKNIGHASARLAHPCSAG